MFEYDTNEIDLLRLRQKNGTAYDLLQSSTYNAQHLPLTLTDPAGQTTTYTYNTTGQLLTVTTPPRAGITENRTTTYAYDTEGRLQSVTAPATGAVTSYTYDGYGRVRTVTDADNYTVTTDFDPLDRPIRVTYPDGSYEETVYGRLDPESRRDRLGRWSHTLSDALRRVVATRDPAGRTTTHEWCTCGSLDKLIDPNGNATSWERDVQGRVTREIRANGFDRLFFYETTTSRLKEHHDSTSPTRQIKGFEYLLDDNLKKITYTNELTPTIDVEWTYSPVYDRVSTMVDGASTTTYNYHPVGVLGAGQVSAIDGPLANDTITYTYDELGRVLGRQINGSANSLTMGYDALGRPTSQTNVLGTFNYAYDAATQRVSGVSYPNGQTTSYSYFDTAGDHRLQQIHHRLSGGATLSKFDYTYDAVGNVVTRTEQMDASPAKVLSLGYDLADQLVTASRAPSETAPNRFAYAYDPAGNRTAEQLDDLVTGASHDNMNHVVSQQPGGALLFRGTLNEPAAVTVQGKPVQVGADNTFSGSATVASGTSTVAVTATDPTGNLRTNTYQVSEAGSSKSFTYDTNGNMTGDGTRTFEWDAENRLVAVKQGETTLASFTYDGLGRRASKAVGGVTRTYVLDRDHIAEERVSGGSVVRFFHGPWIDDWLGRQETNGSATFIVADHLGSVVRQTTSAGQVTLTRSYDPWGNFDQASATVSGPAFTGREWDGELGLYYYRARYYDPRLGRFLSEDPERFATDINFYRYVYNNPVIFTDPSGLQAAGAMCCQSGPGELLKRLLAWYRNQAVQQRMNVATSLGMVAVDIPAIPPPIQSGLHVAGGFKLCLMGLAASGPILAGTLIAAGAYGMAKGVWGFTQQAVKWTAPAIQRGINKFVAWQYCRCF